jgi:uncharacterized protein (DUF983 family)
MGASGSTPVIRYGKPDQSERHLGRSVMRGMLNQCPNCGRGRLFKAFLKPVDQCDVCGEEIFHHRSDDLPPYLVILVLGHVVIGGYMIVDMLHHLPMWATLSIWAPITAIAALLIIQPIKGGVIGLQWALRMHGFGGHDDSPDEFDEGSGAR